MKAVHVLRSWGKANFFFSSFNELDFVSLNGHHVERIMWVIENHDINI